MSKMAKRLIERYKNKEVDERPIRDLSKFFESCDYEDLEEAYTVLNEFLRGEDGEDGP